MIATGRYCQDEPRKWRPQHFTWPLSRRAHVCSSPAEIALTPDSRPMTSTATSLFSKRPFPSCPNSPVPKHLTPPRLLSEQIWRSPIASALTRLGGCADARRPRASVRLPCGSALITDRTTATEPRAQSLRHCIGIHIGKLSHIVKPSTLITLARIRARIPYEPVQTDPPRPSNS